MKTCFKCGQAKPFSGFYAHPRMKECTKRDVTEHREKNIERFREYDRARASLPHRKQQIERIAEAWRKSDKRHMRAHNAVKRAVKKGSLVRHPCVRCGSEKSLAHHEDYDRPLDVMWLCQPCHKVRHKEINMEKSA